MKPFITLLITLCFSASASSQRVESQPPTADEVRQTAILVNDYFMNKYADPTIPTNVKRVRPSNLWTRAVYYEGLMALQRILPQQRYLDYAVRWADYHKFTPRNGVTTCDADDQCCAQTYLELLPYLQRPREELLAPTIANLAHQMKTPNTKNATYNQKTKTTANSLYGWWTWIDAIQMAMPVYFQLTQLTGDSRYQEHAMRMYLWSRDTLAGGLFNEKDGLWWRDADYVPPYSEPDGRQCYWSRGNGWVYAALVRCLSLMPKKGKAYKLLKNDFILMSKAILQCQRDDGFWNPSLVSTNYAMKETSGTALFLYGMAWGIRQGYLKADTYLPSCHKAWQAMAKEAIHHDGFIGWMQGTGKDPSAGQPLSYDKVPDFEDYGTGCVLLGTTEYYQLLNNQ